MLFLLRPLILIRVGLLRTDAVGHLAQNYEMYLCELDAGLHPHHAFDIFFINHFPVCNHQLTEMWGDKLRIHRFASHLYRAISFYPRFEQHLIKTSPRDRYDIFNDCKTHLSFNQEEIETGETALQKMGIKYRDYICVLVRDSSYKEKFAPGRDWAYHSYRDVDVDIYLPALERLANRGYCVLRMGAIVKKKINSSNPEVIDYATNGMRTDFLDIFLSANCHFFISNGSGLDSVAKIFRRPILYTDYLPLEYIRAECSHDLCIPKKLWVREEHRFMTFREILESGVGRFLQTEQYDKCNLEIVNNTTEETEAAIAEMDNRLKGAWVTTEEDEELQRQFWALFKPSDLNRAFRSRIGAEFLRQNSVLLD